MADLGLSQARQIQNLGHSPAGQTGYATGTSGNGYGAASDTSTLTGNAQISESPSTQTANYPFQAVQNHYVVNVSDTVTVSLSTTLFHQMGVSASDSVTITDAATGANHYSNSLSDSFTVSDAEANHYNAVPNPSETVTISAALAGHQVGSASVSAAVTVTEGFTPSVGVAFSLSDTETISDALAFHTGKNVSLSQTVTVSEASTASQGLHLLISETITVSDAVSFFKHYNVDLSDNVTFSALLALQQHGHASVANTLTISESLRASEHPEVFLSANVTLSDALVVHYHAHQTLAVSLPVIEQFSAGSAAITAVGTQLTAGFQQGLRIDGTLNLENFAIEPLDGPGFPVTILKSTPLFNVIKSGNDAAILNTTSTVGAVTFPITIVIIPSVDFTTLNASYLFLTSPTNTETWVRIVSVLETTAVIVDRELLPDPQNGHILWQATTGVQGISLTTTKFTDGGLYSFSGRGLLTLDGILFAMSAPFGATAQRPQVVSATTLTDGQILVTFSDSMLVDPDLQNPREYQLTGPGSPYVESVTTVSPTQVLLFPRNVEAGSYSLQVGTHTPHDLAGNPIDPFFNTVAFSTSAPIDSRSIFTDFGPIARPPLTLETGTKVTFLDYQTVQLTGASIPSTFAGFELVLTGTSNNDGSYLILSVKTQNTVKVVASFNLPDAHASTASWSIVNPRDGEIADDPAHVSVTINGSPVVPQEVIGLLGQIVLSSAPPDGQDVRVNYSWIKNPTVEIRRLNSKEFRLNDWNRDVGYLPTGEHYRYNNVLPVTTNFKTPPPVQQGSHAGIVSASQVSLPDGNILADYTGLTLVLTAGINAGAYDIVSVPDSHHINVSGSVALNPADPLSGNISWTIGDTSDIQAILPQPLLRDLKYRAYERAYTALLNDPNTLTLNAPTNLIAYPPLARIVAQTFVSYESSALPENDPIAPWNRIGTGTASIVALQLVVTSPTSGPFPGGSPIYWLREVDQTFPHVFASTWDMQINATPVTQGVFTGVCFGYSDQDRVTVLGYLLDGTTAKIGFLVRGAGNDPSVITAWTGGLDNAGNPTNAPLAFDWTILHSYRIFQDPAGNISLFLDGAVVPSLQVTQDQLPYLEELAAPFDTLQGVFFGSLSAQAQSTSTWDFVRYLVLPLNPLQTAPSIFVDYVANVLPEAAAKPWTPVGYHGTETILVSAFLLLDSTSAVPASEEAQTGLVGGDFRGFFRLEPLIATNAEVVVDFNVQIRTWTHGFSPNALMVAVDDSDRLIQLSFISDSPTPKFSYGGDGFPTTQTPPWTALGGQTSQMLGRTLQIIDTSPTDGLVYVIDDTNPISPYQNHYVQADSLVASSSMTATVNVQHAASASMSGNSILLPPDIGHAHYAVATLSVGATVSATGTANRGATTLRPTTEDDTPGPPQHHQAQAAIHASALFSPPDIGTQKFAVCSIQAGSSPIFATAQLGPGFTSTIAGGSSFAVHALLSPHSRTLSPENPYILEARLQPITFSADPSGFIGAMAQVYDSQRAVGFLLQSIAGVTYVALQGDGTVVAQFPFNWHDGNLHTYRVVYSPGFPSGVVTLFIDGIMVGTPQDYTTFPVPLPPSSIGFVAFGSSTTISNESTSTVNWIYCNAWRVETGNKFVGVWRGTTTGSLIDYWVPTKVSGSNALVLGNALMDTSVNFVTAGVSMGDYLIVDAGPNQGVYTISGVTPSTLSLDTTWPVAPSRVTYRIAQTTDWTKQHAYRIVKAPSGDDVAVFLDGADTPLIFLTYDDSILPPSQDGLPRIIAGALPSVVWGAFDPTNLSQSSWQYLRYGVTRSPTELRIIPPHQVLNQRNIIQSYERHLSNLPHTLTDFWSESEGITPNTYPDFLTNPGLIAFTLLNEGTPLVPETQTYEVRSPQPVVEFVGALNNIADVLNSDGSFLLNDATRKVGIIIPNDVLYSSLQIIERDTGQTSLIAPFGDESQPLYGPFNFQDEVCLTYNAQTLPENDPTAITPWTFFAQDPHQVFRSVFGGVLTYGTTALGTQTLYRNATPLPDAPSMQTQVTFRLRVLQDTTGGLGDSQVRFGFSAIGLTASLALVSFASGQRYVLVVDQLSNQVLGGIPFDFYDGNYHNYRLVRAPGAGTIQVFVDS